MKMIVRATAKFNGASIALEIGNLSMPKEFGNIVSVRPSDARPNRLAGRDYLDMNPFPPPQESFFVPIISEGFRNEKL